ncbi:NusG domain II-containing protein [Kaarinaea lacus]
MIRWNKWITRGDTIILGLAIAVLSISFATFWQAEGHGAEAIILVKGKRWARLNLFQNQDYYVPGLLGESHIRVENGQVRFIDSPCPNKLCIHTGWIKQGGENVTCLPNQVSVHILGSDTRFDTINF